MIKLQGEKIYLAALEREHVKQLWADIEYDHNSKTESLRIGAPISHSDIWFDQIQKDHEKKKIWLGIFLNDGKPIGELGLQKLDWRNRSADVGMSIAKLKNRSQGFGAEALKLLIEYAFNNLGLERLAANTLEHNYGAQKSLEKCSFVLEGTSRKAVYFAGNRWDRLHYSILRDEYNNKESEKTDE